MFHVKRRVSGVRGGDDRHVPRCARLCPEVGRSAGGWGGSGDKRGTAWDVVRQMGATRVWKWCDPALGWLSVWIMLASRRSSGDGCG